MITGYNLAQDTSDITSFGVGIALTIPVLAINSGHVLSSGVNCRCNSPRIQTSESPLTSWLFLVPSVRAASETLPKHWRLSSIGGRRSLGTAQGAPCRRRRCALCDSATVFHPVWPACRMR